MTDAPAPRRLEKGPRPRVGTLSWPPAVSRIGLLLCGLYLVPSAALLCLAFMANDFKGSVVFGQLALAPFELVTLSLGLQHFIAGRPWMNSILFCYPITHVALYEIGWVAENVVLEGWSRPFQARVAVNLGSVIIAVAMIVSISMTSNWFQARTDARVRSQAHLDGIIYSRLDPSFERQKQQSTQLLWSYPRDPRIRYAHAALMYDDGQTSVAATDLLRILGDQEAAAATPEIVPYARALLARIDLEEGKKDDALTVISSLCRTKFERSLVGDLHLCP